jgi:Cdc6-like AAA superfamily ATPase
MKLSKKGKQRIFGALILVCIIIYLSAEYELIPEENNPIVKLFVLLSALVATTYLGPLVLNQLTGKNLNLSDNGDSFSVKIRKRNLEELRENTKLVSDQYLINLNKDTKLNYITSIPIKVNNKNIDIPYEFSNSAINFLLSGNLTGKNNVIILGDGGTGKTTLIHDFISRTDSNSVEKDVPVFLSLSKWSGGNFEEWIAFEIGEHYGIKSRIAEKLIKEGEILPCLDGLDEVPYLQRPALVYQIQEYAKSSSVIFSCRQIEFQSLPNEFKMEFAICELLPLALDTMKTCLGEFFNDVATQKLVNQEFIKTPLLLNVVATISSELSEEEKMRIIKEENKANLSVIIWSKFDQVMFNKKLNGQSSDCIYNLDLNKQKKLRFWMVWLAKNANERTSEFFIEQLQPSWINDSNGQILYLLISRILTAILLSLSVGLFLSSPLDFIRIGIVLGASMAPLSFITFKIKKNKGNLNEEVLYYQKEFNQNIFSRIKSLDRALNILVFALVLGIVTILYLGFSVPRKPEDLVLNGLFAKTESYVGIFITLFYATIFGLRNQWQNIHKDVRPVERITADWKQFIIKGFVGGFGLAFFLLICALVIDFFHPSSSFGIWLSDKNNSFYGLYGPFLGFIAGFCFGFPIFSVIGWLNENKLSYDDEKKKEKRLFYSNHGVKQSLKNSFYVGILSFLFFGAIFSLYIWLYTGSEQEVVRGLKEGLGASIVASLWFGGMDYIQHWSLRLTVYLKGYAPFDWRRYLKFGKSLTFIRQSGASYSFYHRTLKDYYKEIILEKNLSTKSISPPFLGKIYIFIILFLILVFSIADINRKFRGGFYWEKPNSGIIYEYQSDSTLIMIKSNTFLVKHRGTLRLQAKGKYKVGNFVGYVFPEGTEHGFLGFPIGDTYDSLKEHPHGAILFHLNSDSTWINWVTDSTFFKSPWEYRNNQIEVKEGDTIQFIVNDTEWQNNLGKVIVKMQNAQK